MRATSIKDITMIRLPRPLYNYLLKWPDLNAGETVNEILVNTVDEQQRPRHYRLVPTVTRPRLEKKS